VGNDGETLVADSSATTGLRYQASQAAGKNAIINGGMDIWQRGTSVTGSGGYNYTADRWEGFLASTYTVSQVDVSSVLNNFQYGLRAQRASGQTTTNYFNVEQGLETETIQPLRGNVVTVSFWARCGANFSAASSQLLVTLYAGTGTERVRNVTAYTNETTPINTVATLTTTYQKFTFTSTAIPTTTTQMAWTFASYPTGTAGANDWFEVTGVQMEVGSVATAFTRAGGTIQGELAACQRYYWQSEATAQYFWSGQTTNTNNYYATGRLPVTMRVAPTITLTNRDESSFAATAGSVIRITTNSFLEYRAATATNTGGYYGSSVVASAEL
jgi:hypothetical protein